MAEKLTLRQALWKTGLTQKDLAAECGCCLASITNVMAGKRSERIEFLVAEHFARVDITIHFLTTEE